MLFHPIRLYSSIKFLPGFSFALLIYGGTKSAIDSRLKNELDKFDRDKHDYSPTATGLPFLDHSLQEPTYRLGVSIPACSIANNV